MVTRNPKLGSLALQAHSSETQTIRVTPWTCQDLSSFRAILKEYRQLDDTIIMRLNRANALIRDQEREDERPGTSSVQNQACLAVWRELLANWQRRTELINYCDAVVGESVRRNQESEAANPENPAAQRRAAAAAYSDQVKRDNIQREPRVEGIIRTRAVDAFYSRCRFFSPPQNDAGSIATWEEARKR